MFRARDKPTKRGVCRDCLHRLTIRPGFVRKILPSGVVFTEARELVREALGDEQQTPEVPSHIWFAACKPTSQ
jgi:hypothetical protein